MSRALKQDIIYGEKLNIPKEFLRFATPRDVALYRAERLKCNTIIEIGAGIGGQTLAFAKKCKKIIAIEIDKEKSKLLSQNLKKLKIDNVEIINGDALNKSVINKISKEKVDVVFVDTQRPEQSERNLENIKPSINEILKNYLPLTNKIAIEIPPYTKDLEKINSYKFEQEFISLNNQLNRLTLYFNELKKDNKKIICLPSQSLFICSENKNSFSLRKVDSAKNFKFLYSLDPTLIIANCLEEFISKLDCCLLNLNKPVLISNSKLSNPLITPYKILTICDLDKNIILENLIKYGAGKVVIRYNISPEKYWKERRSFEKNLKGKKEINLFFNEPKNQAILCEKI